MSEVTVEAVQPVLGLLAGDVVTIEATRRVSKAIEAGRLKVIAPFPEPVAEEPVAEPEPEYAPVADVPPLRPGNDNKKDDWVSYAWLLGLEPDGLTKAEIIAMCDDSLADGM